MKSDDLERCDCMGASKIEKLIDDIFEFVEESRSPIGNPNKVILHRAEFYDMLDELKMRTPEEIKRYQKIIANRDKIIEDANREAAIVMEQANSRAAALIDESEMVRQANQKAQEIITAAMTEANRIVSSANEEAGQIRVGAIAYTNDLLTNAEGILQNAYQNTKARYDMVFGALKEDLDIIAANKRELEKDMPREVQKIEEPDENYSEGLDDEIEEMFEE